MKLLTVIGNIFRMFFLIPYSILYVLIYKLIEVITYERGKKGIITLRKAKRIRFFLKLKIFLYEKMRWFVSFINKEDYYKLLYEKMNWYGV